jgi:WD40 repeat protein
MIFRPSHARWEFRRLHAGGTSLALMLFACTFSAFHWILPVYPQVVLHLGNNAQFLEFSPDSSTFVTARREEFDNIGPLRVWDAQTGSERLSLSPGWTSLQAVCFSPDSRFLAAYEKDADLKVWDAQTGEELSRLRPPPYLSTGLYFRFTPDGRFLVFQDLRSATPGTSFVRFWHIRTKKDVGRIEDCYWSIQIAPDCRSIVTLGRDNRYRLDRVMFWSCPADGPPRRLKEFRIRGDNGAFSPDQSTMASFDWPGDPAKPTEITLWDMATGLKRCSFAYNEGDIHVQSLTFSANGRMLMASGGGGTQLDWRTRTTLWDVTSTPIHIGSFSPHATLSSDNQWLAVPHDNGATLYRVAGIQQHGDFTVNADRGPSMWGVYNNRKEYPSLIFSPDARLLAVTGLYHYPPSSPIISRMPSWISRFLYPAGGSVVRLWDTENGKQHAALFGCRQVFFSPDGKMLATLLESSVLKLWALPLRRPLATSLALTIVLWLPLMLIGWGVINLSRRGRAA